MKDYHDILYEIREAIAIITTNRPHVLNAQSRRLIEELDDAFAKAEANTEVRVIVVAGAGTHFSAGHDLGSKEELADREQRPIGPGVQGQVERTESLYLETCLRWRNLSKPTIAMVQGYCIMGGLMLASCCDLIIAAEDALFADRAVRMGGPHVQYFSHPWDLGARKTKELLFTGDYLSAQDALQLGLVNRVVPREKLAEATLQLAGRIALQDPFALKLAKASVNETLDIQGQTAALKSAFGRYCLGVAGRLEKGIMDPSKDAFSVAEWAKARDAKFQER